MEQINLHLFSGELTSFAIECGGVQAGGLSAVEDVVKGSCKEIGGIPGHKLTVPWLVCPKTRKGDSWEESTWGQSCSETLYRHPFKGAGT